MFRYFVSYVCEPVGWKRGEYKFLCTDIVTDVRMTTASQVKEALHQNHKRESRTESNPCPISFQLLEVLEEKTP